VIALVALYADGLTPRLYLQGDPPKYWIGGHSALEIVQIVLLIEVTPLPRY
jgi:hypothetical protein